MVIFAAIFFCVILIALSGLQIALIFGRPLGEYAWGGEQKVLSKKLRIASAFSVAIYALMMLIALDRAQIFAIFADPNFSRTAIWLLAAYFALGTFVNGISRSKKERSVMTPVCIALLISCLIVGSNG